MTKTRIPIFLIHGERDRMVPPEMSERIYHACVSPKKLWIAKKAGHLEVFYKYPREYRRRVLEFYEACENGSLVKTEKESRVGV